jgi:hypothetical protein
MWKDPIVEEIHTVRERIARECDYDMKQIIARLRKHEKEHADRIVHKIEQRMAAQVGDKGLPERE